MGQWITDLTVDPLLDSSRFRDLFDL